MMRDLAIVLLSCLFFAAPAMAGDLDDGISEFTDESISADDSLGQADTNVNFIVVKAMADAKKKQKREKDCKDGEKCKAVSKFDTKGDFNQNSVIVGPGSTTGDITNVIIQK